MTKSLGNKLLGDETQVWMIIDVKVHLGVVRFLTRSLRSWFMTVTVY